MKTTHDMILTKDYLLYKLISDLWTSWEHPRFVHIQMLWINDNVVQEIVKLF